MSEESPESTESSAEPSAESAVLRRVAEASAPTSAARAATARVATSSSAARPRPETEDTDIMVDVGAVTKLRNAESRSPGVCAEEWRCARFAFALTLRLRFRVYSQSTGFLVGCYFGAAPRDAHTLSNSRGMPPLMNGTSEPPRTPQPSKRAASLIH